MSTTATRPGHHGNDDAQLLPFGKEHLEDALRLSQEMSWPYRLEDWAIALDLGQGFVLLDGAGSVIATAAWWAYGEEHASAGMIIVAKAAQGRGHGAGLGDCHVLVREGEPRGCAISRRFGRGQVIGPMVAERAADARALIEAALARLGQVFVRVDATTTSQLEDWLESIGLRQVGDATTMVLGN